MKTQKVILPFCVMHVQQQCVLLLERSSTMNLWPALTGTRVARESGTTACSSLSHKKAASSQIKQQLYNISGYS